MIKTLPFYQHPGEGRCFQACLKSVLKVLQPGNDYDYETLDRISGRPRGDFGTWPVKPAIELSKAGFYVKYYSGIDANRFIKDGMGYLKEILPADIISRMDLGSFNEAKMLAPVMLKMNLFECGKVDFNFLQEELNKDRYPILMITTTPYTGQKDNFGEHYVVMLGIEDQYIYIHDSANFCHGKQVKEVFNHAFNPLPVLNEAFIIGIR